METNQCKHIMKDGQQCRAHVLKGKDRCFRHDPESRALSLNASRKGGLMNKHEMATAIPLESMPVNAPRDVAALLSDTINQVRHGTMDPRIANTIAYLSLALIKSQEVAEIEGKVSEIRAALLGRETSDKRRIGR